MKIKSIEIVDESKLSNFGRITAAMLDQHAKAGKLWITREGSTYYLHIGNRKVYLWGYYNDFFDNCAWLKPFSMYTTLYDYVMGNTDMPIEDICHANWEYNVVAQVFGSEPTFAAGKILAVLAKKCHEDFLESEDKVDIENFDVIKKPYKKVI